MARNWSATFDSWWQPVSDTENDKCERAERMIKAAIAESVALRSHSIRVFTQGSYRNDTNVRQDSDVDIAVCLTDVFIPDFTLENSLSGASLGLQDSTYSHEALKDDVGAALVAYFGRAHITRGNKAYDVHENTSRVDADVVPCLVHRVYYKDSHGSPQYLEGTHIKSDSGKHIENYPDQHADEGVRKNTATTANTRSASQCASIGPSRAASAR